MVARIGSNIGLKYQREDKIFYLFGKHLLKEVKKRFQGGKVLARF